MPSDTPTSDPQDRLAEATDAARRAEEQNTQDAKKLSDALDAASKRPTGHATPYPKLKPKNGTEVQTLVSFAELLIACDRPGPEWVGGPTSGRNLRAWVHAMRNGNEGGATAAATGAKHGLATHLHGPEVVRIIDLCGEYIFDINNPLSAQVAALIGKLESAGFDVPPTSLTRASFNPPLPPPRDLAR
ncbi:hypothetical protein [Limnoglobus roseus]|uniref:Uncharacterized protein n=1 Tax=Limnoglobus roseus TaxID=2598579 RepID=A0A5C1AMS6_9BACT|nr:hypothetical protein [Limnoglobus roseus]QEL20541.1 hypothetical protein PX52LOC_07646 [Limnoglobus roseus]